ncbi:hypothetical protein BDQ17DRAFT_1335411 [Cyathus striatus]|nr:hypothetical protein BDQ17DRAFT_1335411 [Cyathus striatus]
MALFSPTASRAHRVTMTTPCSAYSPQSKLGSRKVLATGRGGGDKYHGPDTSPQQKNSIRTMWILNSVLYASTSHQSQLSSMAHSFVPSSMVHRKQEVKSTRTSQIPSSRFSFDINATDHNYSPFTAFSSNVNHPYAPTSQEAVLEEVNISRLGKDTESDAPSPASEVVEGGQEEGCACALNDHSWFLFGEWRVEKEGSGEEGAVAVSSQASILVEGRQLKLLRQRGSILVISWSAVVVGDMSFAPGSNSDVLRRRDEELKAVNAVSLFVPSTPYTFTAALLQLHSFIYPLPTEVRYEKTVNVCGSSPKQSNRHAISPGTHIHCWVGHVREQVPWKRFGLWGWTKTIV